MEDFIQLVSSNKEWLFSGAGLTFLALIWRFVKRIVDRNKAYFIFNMHGIHFQADVKTCGIQKSIKGVRVDEQIVDFVSFFNKSGIVLEDDHTRICNLIEKECLKFKANSKHVENAYFTGMSPIPYEVYAGTFFNGSNVNNFLEYDSKKTKKFYEMAPTYSYTKKMLFGEESLHFCVEENFKESKELNVLIEVTSQINDQDLSQFQNFSSVKLSLYERKDNLIRRMDQLLNLKNDISILLEKYGKRDFCRIHITAAIPSCLAVEIGKEVAQLGNRLPEVVVYHYVHANIPKYPFGVVVNGVNKGMLYHVV